MDDDGRTLNHDKSSHGLWPGELEIEKKMDDVLALRLENKRAIHR